MACFAKDGLDDGTIRRQRQTEAERLIYEIAVNKKRKTNQEWLDLQKEVREFLKAATEEDRNLIGGYTESLSMICSAIEEGLV